MTPSRLFCCQITGWRRGVICTPSRSTQRQSSSSRSDAGSSFRRRLARKEPKLSALLDDPLTQMMMRAVGVDQHDLVDAVNVMANKLLLQEIR
jgi:hypothetical protein